MSETVSSGNRGPPGHDVERADGRAGQAARPSSLATCQSNDQISSRMSPRQLTVSNLLQNQLRGVPATMAPVPQLTSSKSDESSDASQWYRDSNQNVRRSGSRLFVDSEEILFLPPVIH